MRSQATHLLLASFCGKPSTAEYLLKRGKERFDDWTVSTEFGNQEFQEDVSFSLPSRNAAQTSGPVTSPLVKVIFDASTLIGGSARTASARAALIDALKSKIDVFCKTIARECSIAPGDSGATAFNIKILGNVNDMNVFSKDHWWKAILELLVTSEIDLSDPQRRYDVILLRIQRLDLAKSPADKQPLDESYRSLAGILEGGSDTNVDAKPW